jgi:hypothetical protein
MGIIGNTHGVSRDKAPNNIAAQINDHKEPLGFAPMLALVERLLAGPAEGGKGVSCVRARLVSGVGEAVGDGEAPGDGDTVGVGEPFGDGVGEGVGVGVGELFGDGDALGAPAARFTANASFSVFGGRQVESLQA